MHKPFGTWYEEESSLHSNILPTLGYLYCYLLLPCPQMFIRRTTYTHQHSRDNFYDTMVLIKR